MRKTRAPGLAVLASVLSGWDALGREPGTATPSEAVRARQPVALAIVDGGKTLLAANGRSGSLSVVDTATRRVVAEHDVGRGLADLAVLPDGRHLLAVDRAAGELLLLEHRDRSLRVVGRIAVGPDPVRVVVPAGGSSCVVASTWPRRLTFVEPAPAAPQEATPGSDARRTIDLPFSPREMAALPGGSRLVVADAFGGRLAVVDPRDRYDRVGPIAAGAQHPGAGPLARRPDAARRPPDAQPPGPDDVRRRPLGPVDPQSPAGPAVDLAAVG